jgi:MscS family membrane protein
MDWLKDNYAELLQNPFVRSALIIVGSIVMAKLTDWIFVGIFKRWSSKTNTNLDDNIVNFLHKPIFYSILFFGFSTGVNLLGLPEYINFAILGVFKTATILIWLSLFVKVFTLSMDWTTRRTDNKLLQSRTLPLFNNLGKIAIGLFGAYFIFLSWNININGILASAGVLGVVLGLAAKDTVANFFAGVFLMADSPFKEGDYIMLETGERGYVKNMGLRSTRFMTRDDIEITIPNSVIAAAKIINESGGSGVEDIERVRISLQVAYGSDVDQVKDILQSIAINNKDVLDNPDPRVRFREFADSGIRLELLFWIFKPETRGRIVDTVNTEIYKQFKQNGVTIPYPTMKVLMPDK